MFNDLRWVYRDIVHVLFATFRRHKGCFSCCVQGAMGAFRYVMQPVLLLLSLFFLLLFPRSLRRFRQLTSALLRFTQFNRFFFSIEHSFKVNDGVADLIHIRKCLINFHSMTTLSHINALAPSSQERWLLLLCKAFRVQRQHHTVIVELKLLLEEVCVASATANTIE